MSTFNVRWPTKIPGNLWKIYDENKRGGMLVKAGWEQVDKDIIDNEIKKWHGLQIQPFGKKIHIFSGLSFLHQLFLHQFLLFYNIFCFFTPIFVFTPFFESCFLNQNLV